MNNLNFETSEKRFIGRAEEYKFRINGSDENVQDVIAQRKQQEVSEGMKKYMPIGSVVSLTGNNQLVMIVGFNHKINLKVYDYVCCVYPYGIGENNGNFVFNHDQIDKVYHVGYINNLEKMFKSELNSNDFKSKGNVK